MSSHPIAKRFSNDNNCCTFFFPSRVNLFEALLRETDSSVRDILAETLRLVASYDFPDEWPTLIPTIVAQLQTGEVLRYGVAHFFFLAFSFFFRRRRTSWTHGVTSCFLQLSLTLLAP